MTKNYEELSRLNTFEERFEYLKLDSSVGERTFGFDRIFNQMFYKSSEWDRIRDYVIARDYGCDLGLRGEDICGKILVHHMNPIRLEDIQNSTEFLLNPNYLVCCSHKTHNGIHYSNFKMLGRDILVDRMPNDTCPWKH